MCALVAACMFGIAAGRAPRWAVRFLPHSALVVGGLSVGLAPSPSDGPRAGRLHPGRQWRRRPRGIPAVAFPPLPGLPAGLSPLLPPGGRAWFPADRIVAYYGNPLAPAMGVLGQYPPAVMLARLRTQAAAYAALDPGRPVVPALELVADVAQAAPGPSGLYRMRMPYALITRELALARQAHALLILDLQVGRSSVAAELPYFAPFLAQPDVELALDPEFAMPPGEVPGKWIGTLPAAQINWAVNDLAALVVRYHLPEKILIVHQFTPGMVPNWRGIRVRPGVQFVFDTDGYGGQAKKEHNYRAFITDQPVPPVRYGGIKLFYRYDTPLMTPSTVLTLRPAPSLIIYQ